MRNLSKKTMKHMAKRALFQMDPYNPIIRDAWNVIHDVINAEMDALVKENSDG